MITYYQDTFNCVCGHSYIIKVPMKWAYTNPMSFQLMLHKQEQAQKDHYLCALVAEVKAFLKIPVMVSVGRGYADKA